MNHPPAIPGGLAEAFMNNLRNLAQAHADACLATTNETAAIIDNAKCIAYAHAADMVAEMLKELGA